MLLAIDSSAGASAAVIHHGAVAAQWRTEATTTHVEVLAEAVQWVLDRVRAADGERATGAESATSSAAADGPESSRLPETPEAVVVGVGPGPFTGLRVGLALAHSLAEAWGVPLFGVCSLDSIAHRAVQHGVLATPEGPFLVTTDARRREIYGAVYQILHQHDGPGRPAGGESFVTAPAEAPRLPAVGIGAGLYPDHLQPPPATPEAAGQADVAGWLPDAVELGLIAEQDLTAQPQISEWGVVGLEAGERVPGTALRPPFPLYLRESDAKVPAQMQKQPSGSGGAR